MASAYPAGTSSFTNCTGALSVLDASAAPPGTPFYGYANRTLSGNISTTSPFIAVWGDVVEIRIIVTTPYTGVRATLPMTLSQFGFFDEPGNTGSGRINETINLKEAGERDIFPTQVLGAQPGDTLVVPGAATRLFNGQLQPYVASSIGTESPNVYPVVQVIVQTTGGFPQ